MEISNRSTQQTLNEGYIFGSINCFIYLVCFIFSIILNLPLIINWILNGKKENYPDLLIISITVTDFIDGVFVCLIYFTENLIEMNLINSNLISSDLVFIADSMDYSAWLISPASLFLLSLHRLKQLISPFKEGVKLNRFRVVTIISIWFIFPILGFLINWSRTLIKNEQLIDLLYHITDSIIIISTCVANILIIVQFKSKLKNSRLNKKNFKNENKAILCTLSLGLLLLITCGPLIILEPFKIYKYDFVEYLHDIFYSFSYFYTIINPLILVFFNRRFRICCK